MKHSTWGLILVVFVIGAAVGYRFGLGGPEDTWLCRDGAWVQHGHPSSPMPTEPCGSPAPTDSVMCTMEAKECPDGSYVGRTGPRCEFAPCPGGTDVFLYLYDVERDKDVTGNVLCTDYGLVAVKRVIPHTLTPIQDAIRELLKGELTDAERAAGITSQFPVPGLSLTAASLRDGVLTLTFADPQNLSGGGSCRVGIRQGQIDRTARQFEGVQSVIIKPDTLFQP